MSCFSGHYAQPEQKPAKNIYTAANKTLSFEGIPVEIGAGKLSRVC
jgi:hypothetical protein